jgi:hypothetical protein
MNPADTALLFDELGFIIEEVVARKEAFYNDLRQERVRVLVETKSGKRAWIHGANWTN